MGSGVTPEAISCRKYFNAINGFILDAGIYRKQGYAGSGVMPEEGLYRKRNHTRHVDIAVMQEYGLVK